MTAVRTAAPAIRDESLLTCTRREVEIAAAAHAATGRDYSMLLAKLAAETVRLIWDTAAVLVFNHEPRDGEHAVTLLMVRDADGELLWFNPPATYTHPDTRRWADAHGRMPDLEMNARIALLDLLTKALDADPDGYLFPAADDDDGLPDDFDNPLQLRVAARMRMTPPTLDFTRVTDMVRLSLPGVPVNVDGDSCRSTMYLGDQGEAADGSQRAVLLVGPAFNLEAFKSPIVVRHWLTMGRDDDETRIDWVCPPDASERDLANEIARVYREQLATGWKFNNHHRDAERESWCQWSGVDVIDPAQRTPAGNTKCPDGCAASDVVKS